MKTEAQLCLELGIDRRTLMSIRKKKISRDSWFRKANRIYYTQKGEHIMRNEIQKSVLRLLDAWQIATFLAKYTTFSRHQGSFKFLQDWRLAYADWLVRLKSLYQWSVLILKLFLIPVSYEKISDPSSL